MEMLETVLYFVDLREWMKSLRLHKYSDRLLGYGYDELLALTEDDLQKLLFTDGAKGKLMKQILLIKERPARIKEIKGKLEVNCWNVSLVPNVSEV